MNTYKAPTDETPTARDIITNPQAFHQAPAVLQSSWADLKAQRGQPITPERMARLHPAYGILTIRPTLQLPGPGADEPAHSPERMARISAATRRIAAESGYFLPGQDSPFGGTAA